MAASIEQLTQEITNTINEVNNTLDTELTQILDALENASGGDQAVLQAAIDEQTMRLTAFRDALRSRIENIIP